MSSIESGVIAPGADAIWRASLNGGVAREIGRIPNHSVLGIVAASDQATIWSPNGDQSIVIGAQDENSREAGFWKVELSSGTASRLFEDRVAFCFPTDFALATGISADNRTIAYFSEDAQHPPDIWIAGPDLTDRHRLTDVNSQLDSRSLGSTQILSYDSSDGHPLHGALVTTARVSAGRTISNDCLAL